MEHGGDDARDGSCGDGEKDSDHGEEGRRCVGNGGIAVLLTLRAPRW